MSRDSRKKLDPAAHRPFDTVEAFVLGCTDEIWVDRAVGLIESRYYAPDVVLHGAFGTSRGAQPVVEGTAMSIASYGDEVGYGEDVLWEQRGRDGFVSSHRIYSTGTNTGWTDYGPPTGRHFEKRALAHCLVRAGRIVEEWVVRDECRLVQDLGYDVQRIAERLAEQSPWQPLELGGIPEKPLASGVSGERDSDTALENCQRILEMVEHTWNRRRLDGLASYFHRDIVLHTTRGRTFQGIPQLSTENLDLLAAFPDARVSVLDICAHDHPRTGRHRISTVWLLRGTYSGHEQWGPRTGLPVELLGSSHYLLDNNGLVVREYRVYDELALRVQIEQARGAPSGAAGGDVADAGEHHVG